MKCCHLFPLTLYILEFFVQDSLCVLNVSGNNIDDIRDLGGLRRLQHFSAADNKLQQVAVKTTFLFNFQKRIWGAQSISGQRRAVVFCGGSES